MCCLSLDSNPAGVHTPLQKLVRPCIFFRLDAFSCHPDNSVIFMKEMALFSAFICCFPLLTVFDYCSEYYVVASIAR